MDEPSTKLDVRIWKPELFMCSTIRAAETLCCAPAIDDADDQIINVEQQAAGEDDPHVLVYVEYWLSPAGEVRSLHHSGRHIQPRLTHHSFGFQLAMQVRVDTTKMVTYIPRVGLQFNLAKQFDAFSWSGLGPHECYQV